MSPCMRWKCTVPDAGIDLMIWTASECVLPTRLFSFNASKISPFYSNRQKCNISSPPVPYFTYPYSNTPNSNTDVYHLQHKIVMKYEITYTLLYYDNDVFLFLSQLCPTESPKCNKYLKTIIKRLPRKFEGMGSCSIVVEYTHISYHTHLYLFGL